jgi:hypothetical protein
MERLFQFEEVLLYGEVNLYERTTILAKDLKQIFVLD